MSGPRFRLGLVVGKMAPLHRGHEWLVAQAAARCERVLVISYSKPVPEGCETARRQGWLEARFPDRGTHEVWAFDDVRVAEVCAARGIVPRPLPRNDDPDPQVHRRWLAWLLGEVLQRRPDAMFGSEDYIEPCAADLSGSLGHPVAAVCFDPTRSALPLSASAIRRDPGSSWHGLAPEVAQGFVRRVALLGGESSGKTTLARALAQRLGSAWVHEYGRELWEARHGALVEADLLDIAVEQIRLEDEATSRARGWLVCDTTPLTTLGYAHWMYGRADPRLVALAERRYHRIVLCEPDFAHVQDGWRRESAFRDEQHAWYLERLQRGHTPWLRVAGPVERRVARVLDWLAQAEADPPVAAGAGSTIGGCTPPLSPR